MLTFSVFGQETASFSKVYKEYEANPQDAIGKYRDKVIMWSASATSINRSNDVGKYQISLDGLKGRIIISKNDIPEELNKILWKQRSIRNSKLQIKFKGKWKSNRSKSFYFYEVEEITWTPPGKKKKKK
jgi:hypothetical protein